LFVKKKVFLETAELFVKKNASVFWVFLNRHVQKMLNYFEDSSPLYDFYGKDLSNKKNQRSLPSLCPEIFCRKSTHFFKKRVILLAPTVYQKSRRFFINFALVYNVKNLALIGIWSKVEGVCQIPGSQTRSGRANDTEH
jgi:hypothetical protein